MEGNGPTGGTVQTDAHAVCSQRFLHTGLFRRKADGTGSHGSLDIIRQAVERGLAHPDEITLKGGFIPENMAPFRVPDTKSLNFTDSLPKFLRKPFFFAAAKILKSYPILKKEDSIGCGNCAGELSRSYHQYRIKGRPDLKREAASPASAVRRCVRQKPCISVRKAL